MVSFETGLSLELAGVVAGEPGCGVSLSREVTSHRSSGESEGLVPSPGCGLKILGSKR